MAEAIPYTTTAAAGPSVRAPLAAAVLVSAVTLSIATFELAMADWPSGFVLLLVVPLVALIFCGCALWSATLLLRLRKGGLKFALPFLVLWLLSPIVTDRMNLSKRPRKTPSLTKKDRRYLRQVARQTWRFFDDLVFGYVITENVGGEVSHSFPSL